MQMHPSCITCRSAVYTADSTHWVWPSTTKIGQVELSDELKAKLYQMIDEG